MKYDKTHQYLNEVDLFKDIPPEDLNLIISDSYTREFTPDEVLFYQGDPAEHFYVVMEGRIKLSQLDEDGNQVTFHYLKPKEAFGIIAVLRSIKYPVTAEAMGSCTVIGWDAKKIGKWIRIYPQIALNSIQILSGFILNFQDRIRELSTERVERRIARLLLRLASHGGQKTDQGISLGLKLTRQDIAEMVGTTLYTVSRTLNKWEYQKLVDCRSKVMVIINPHELTNIAENI
ncbi:Crp/Fnr family transcriptional regulator [bacterium]|nr:Crp/Fnr family transcriptional regulator [bacterium]